MVDSLHQVMLFLIFFKTVHVCIRFCDIRNNEGLGKCYQPPPSALVDNTYLDLDYSGYHTKPHPIIV